MMKTKLVGVAAVVTAFLGLVSLVPAAQAAPKSRVGVLPLRGAGEGPVRAKITNALKANGYQIVGSQQLDSTASGLGVNLDGDAGLKAVAKELNIAAFVGGELSKKKADLTVRNGADATVLAEASFAGANPKKIAAAVGGDFWRQLGPAVRLGKPPAGGKAKAAIAEDATPAEEEAAAPAPPPPPPPESRKKTAKRAAEPPPPRAEAASESEAGKESAESASKEPAASAAKDSANEESDAVSAEGGALPAFTFGVGGRALFRKLSWHQDVQPRQPPYSLSPGPELALWFEAFPAAFVSDHFAANLGLFGAFDNGFGVTSTATSAAATPIKLTTKFRDFLVGVKVRLPLGAVAPYLSVAYGAQSFSLVSTTAASGVPSINDKFIRLGVGSRIAVGAVGSLDLTAAYLLVTDPGSQAGEIRSATYFPHATAKALDLGASFGYRLHRLFGVRAGLDFRQYGYDFKVRPTDPPPIAGGAIDRYITLFAGVEVILDGVGGGAASSGDEDEQEAAPAPPPPAHKQSKARKKTAEPAAEPEES
jgi:hypothetical protein